MKEALKITIHAEGNVPNPIALENNLREILPGLLTTGYSLEKGTLVARGKSGVLFPDVGITLTRSDDHMTFELRLVRSRRLFGKEVSLPLYGGIAEEIEIAVGNSIHAGNYRKTKEI